MGLIIGIVVVGICIFLVVRSRQPQAGNAKRPAGRAPANLAQTSKYHAVTINCPDTACDAAKALVDAPTLSSKAPILPLPDCDATECHCRFVHHADRRRKSDRRDQFRDSLGPESGAGEKEKRRLGDRRNSDPEDYFS